MTDDRHKYLKEFGKELEKTYGKNAFVVASKAPRNLYLIPTGIFAIDTALGGGIPGGRISLFFGEKSGGKTTTALRTVREAQQLCATCFYKLPGRVPELLKELVPECKCKKPRTFMCAWIDAENVFNHEWAEKIGVDMNELYLSKPEYAEEAIDINEGLLRSGKVDMVVIDSVASMAASEELGKSSEKDQYAVLARKFNKGIRKAVSAMIRVGRDEGRTPTFLLINQVRMKVGVIFGDPTVVPGGKAQGFATSTETKMWSKSGAKMDSDTGKPLSSPFGFKIVKNKVYPPFIAGEYIMLHAPTTHKKHSDIYDEESVLKLALKYKLIQEKKTKPKDRKTEKVEYIWGDNVFTAKTEVLRFALENPIEVEILRQQLMKIIIAI